MPGAIQSTSVLNCAGDWTVRAPDYTAVRSQDTFHKGGAVVRAERAGRVNLVSKAREENLAIPFEVYLLPG